MKALRRRSGLIAALITAAMATPAAAPAFGQEPAPSGTERFVPGELIVRFDPGVSRRESRELAGDLDARVVDRIEIVPNLALVDLPPGLGVDRGDALFESLDGVVGAEPNALRRTAVEPNDPFYVSGSQWSLDNPDDTDIDAPGAWGLAMGDPAVTVAVIDTGASITHPDLEANIWANPGETLDGVDNGDTNLLADDLHGYDFVNEDTEPVDDNEHGSHVAGIAGAVGNNGVGVTGVNWDVGLMPLKAGDAQGDLTTFDIIAATEYAVENGARVVNASYTGNSFSAAERDAIAAAPDVLFVAAAGNQRTDNDLSPRYPCNYDLANVICVAATNQFDSLSTVSSGGSNFGKASVDLAAPGSSVLSTIPFPSTAFEPPVFEDDFEAGLANWTTIEPGSTWAEEENPPAGFHLSDSPGGSYAPDSNTSAQLTDPLDLTEAASCRMKFALAYALGAGDRLWVEARTDPGPAAWTPLATYSGSDIALDAVVDLFGFSGTAGVYLRFRLQSDAALEADGAHVDDFEVECVDPANPSIYEPKSGTSMATPHVAGTAALLLDRFPAYTTAELRAALLGNVDRLASLHCKVASGGRLNAFNAVDRGAPANPPAEDCPPVVGPPAPDLVQPQQAKPNKCKKIKDKRKRKKCNRKRRLAGL